MNHMQYESLESAQTNIFFSVIFGTTDEKRRLSQDFKPWVCKIYRELSARNWGAGTYIWELSQQNIIMLRSNVITKSTLLSFKENTLKTYYVNENGSFDREVRSSKWRKFEKITVDNVSTRSSDNLSESHYQS